ncbi:hypothetical protein [Hugenholtzia roseola]|uniref:hypothetical protein n=1 Tax=Hugenholtzia roseola TaxID=1002 RepID=UPI00041E8678|nr:hypothetical protein [Hugenholtzia roseola]
MLALPTRLSRLLAIGLLGFLSLYNLSNTQAQDKTLKTLAQHDFVEITEQDGEFVFFTLCGKAAHSLSVDLGDPTAPTLAIMMQDMMRFVPLNKVKEEKDGKIHFEYKEQNDSLQKGWLLWKESEQRLIVYMNLSEYTFTLEEKTTDLLKLDDCNKR